MEIRGDDISAIMHLQAIGIIKDLGGELFGFTSNIISDLLLTNYYPLYRKGLGTIPDINEPQNFLKDVLGLLTFIHHDVLWPPIYTHILYSKANRNAQIFRHDEEPEEIPFVTER